jgi:hypothetical protein
LCIDARLFGLQLILPQLLFEEGDLNARGRAFRLLSREHRLGLHFAVPNLLVVENRDGVAGLDQVAFPHANLKKAPGGLSSHRRVVSFDPAAQDNDAGRSSWRREEHFPNEVRNPCDDDEQKNRERDLLASDFLGSGWGGSRLISRLLRRCRLAGGGSRLTGRLRRRCWLSRGGRQPWARRL